MAGHAVKKGKTRTEPAGRVLDAARVMEVCNAVADVATALPERTIRLLLVRDSPQREGRSTISTTIDAPPQRPVVSTARAVTTWRPGGIRWPSKCPMKEPGVQVSARSPST